MLVTLCTVVSARTAAGGAVEAAPVGLATCWRRRYPRTRTRTRALQATLVDKGVGAGAERRAAKGIVIAGVMEIMITIAIAIARVALVSRITDTETGPDTIVTLMNVMIMTVNLMTAYIENEIAIVIIRLVVVNRMARTRTQGMAI